MNRIDQTFASLNQQNKTALIPYLTVGDPDVKATLDIIHELEMAGADIIELGVPYSDPRRWPGHPACFRACPEEQGEHPHLHGDRAPGENEAAPFILFTYYNPVLQTGLDVFFEEVVRHDISGLIIPDLPVEESEEVRKRAHAAGVHLIPLVAPTSHERIASIASEATGFVYCVSSLGVTGERNDFYSGVESFLETVKQYSNVPIAIGFGISSGEQVARFSKICDGVVVGSAIVRQIESTIPSLRKKRQDSRDFCKSESLWHN